MKKIYVLLLFFFLSFGLIGCQMDLMEETPVIIIEAETITQTTITFTIEIENDRGKLVKIYLRESDKTIRETFDLETRSFTNLQEDTEYAIVVEYEFNTFFGIVKDTITESLIFSTLANINPSFSYRQNEQGYYYYTHVDETNYYFTANDLIGEDLIVALRTILHDDFQPVRYEDAKTILADADVSLTNETKVYNVYDSALVTREWDSVSWHREHVWPNSRLGVPRVTASKRNIASDLHNLRTITQRVNSSRSNRFFTEGSGSYYIADNGGWYPGDDHRGDMARIILYMVVMYEELTLIDDVTLLNVDNFNYQLEGAVMGQLSVLLKWHREDPVDDFEMQRNQVIYETQGNRNPFIDKPEYVHLIWDDMSIQSLLELTIILPEATALFTKMIYEQQLV
ncbi:MAG: endonuclease [Acholeplasmataceae bacterium]|nr:endonuclease [Acholeplasmataceae bacterium]